MTSHPLAALNQPNQPPATPRRRDLLREYFLNAVTLAVLKEGGSELEKQGVREEFMRLIRQAHQLPNHPSGS